MVLAPLVPCRIRASACNHLASLQSLANPSSLQASSDVLSSVKTPRLANYTQAPSSLSSTVVYYEAVHRSWETEQDNTTAFSRALLLLTGRMVCVSLFHWQGSNEDSQARDLAYNRYSNNVWLRLFSALILWLKNGPSTFPQLIRTETQNFQESSRFQGFYAK